MKRKPVELLYVNVICPTTKTLVLIEPKKLLFRGWKTDCNICGSHGKVDMDIGVCPSCGKSHPATILMEY